MKPKHSSASPLAFLALTYALSLPWWGLSLVLRAPGLPDRLPITDLGAVFMPALAAIILIHRERGRRGVIAVLRRLADWDRVRGAWWLVLLGLPPVLYVATFAGMRLLGFDVAVPSAIGAPLALTFVVFFLGAVGEELGYTGYATDPLLRRASAPMTAVMLGVPWALWHLPSMILIGQPTDLILWGLAATVAYRVIYVEIYARSGCSLFSVVLLHALFNTGRTAFPGGHEGFEAGNAAVGYGLVVLVALGLSLLLRPCKET
ncbi:CPBP family intramembrane glutamic endopeptidase [Bauldia sp.]|uniref:CPBP family intramembrane glutamic endopeptidase n=1 Tax=Bauldia sp. TaxID=2575872 RepID=UPI003BABADE8